MVLFCNKVMLTDLAQYHAQITFWDLLNKLGKFSWQGKQFVFTVSWNADFSLHWFFSALSFMQPAPMLHLHIHVHKIVNLKFRACFFIIIVTLCSFPLPNPTTRDNRLNPITWLFSSSGLNYEHPRCITSGYCCFGLRQAKCTLPVCTKNSDRVGLETVVALAHVQTASADYNNGMPLAGRSTKALCVYNYTRYTHALNLWSLPAG